jgi:hypothetical protein
MAQDKSDDIHDALNAMADGDTVDANEATDEHEAVDPTAVEDAGEADEAGFEMDAGPAATPTRRRKPANASSGRRRGPTPMARTAVKVCMVVGMLLLIPALWAVAVLIGLDVPMSGGKGLGVSANSMAYLMLVCWPIALALIIGAFMYGKQIAAADAAAAAEAAKKTEPDPAAEI